MIHDRDTHIIMPQSHYRGEHTKIDTISSTSHRFSLILKWIIRRTPMFVQVLERFDEWILVRTIQTIRKYLWIIWLLFAICRTYTRSHLMHLTNIWFEFKMYLRNAFRRVCAYVFKNQNSFSIITAAVECVCLFDPSTRTVFLFHVQTLNLFLNSSNTRRQSINLSRAGLSVLSGIFRCSRRKSTPIYHRR